MLKRGDRAVESQVVSSPTPWLPRVRYYVPLRSAAFYAAAAVPLGTAIDALRTGAGWEWYALAVALSLAMCGVALRARRRWTGYLLLWVAMMLLLLFGFGDLGPGFHVLSSVIVLVAFGVGLLAVTGGARQG